MTNDDYGSTSVWMATADMPAFGVLHDDIEADVCVVGGGIAGLTSAYLLAREGKEVVLVDALKLGAGETGRTTAHFFPPDERYFHIAEWFGAHTARLVAASYHQSTNLVESIVRAEHIDCDFERLDGYLYSLSAEGQADLDKEFEAARKAGVDITKVDQVPGLSFDTGPCLRFANQAQIHPLKYLRGLAEGIVRRNGRIYTGTRARDVKGDKHRRVVLTAEGQVRADSVVVATNTPFNNRVVMHTKQSGYLTYVVGLRVPKGSVPHVLLWDTGNPYYYIRLQRSETSDEYETLIVGGQDHKVGQEDHHERRYDELETWVRERFPMAGPVEFKWSGEVMEPVDGLAYLGRNPMDNGNVYIITGDSGNGMTHGTVGAMIIDDLIMERNNVWAEVYDPARKPYRAVSEFVKGQANTVAQYGDWLSPGEVHTVHEIAVGQGAIIREGTKKLAVYRDADRELHVLSAACTHLGCAVAWNSAEKSWDCPCHGSRYDVAGQVLHGPAKSPLAAATLQEPPAESVRLKEIPIQTQTPH
jgi:glycine/D-amino acid oxidase-like deaminating enzyme/nitrite reductase/ring-hydroxylating ferredoxin subunit